MYSEFGYSVGEMKAYSSAYCRSFDYLRSCSYNINKFYLWHFYSFRSSKLAKYLNNE